MISLHPPPKQNASQQEWEQYWEKLYRYLKGIPVVTGDMNEVISSGTTYHAVSSLSAPRTLTLPLSANLADGDEIIVQDESGLAGTNTITIARQSSDTINGGTSVTITTNYGRRRIIKRGAGKYFSA